MAGVIRWWLARRGEPDLSSCPYYRGEGICTTGCWEEPLCITDEPINGWPSERLRRILRLPFKWGRRDK